MNNWIYLSEAEEDEIWNKFRKEFEFRPSVHEIDFPGIKEPIPSVTYDVSYVFSSVDREALVTDLQKKLLKAFQRVTKQGELVYAMDWQHQCYKFDPKAKICQDWEIPALPDGDYYIFLTKDLMYGQFGHPWEESICVFGKEFLNVLSADLPRMFTKVIRSR